MGRGWQLKVRKGGPSQAPSPTDPPPVSAPTLTETSLWARTRLAAAALAAMPTHSGQPSALASRSSTSTSNLRMLHRKGGRRVGEGGDRRGGIGRDGEGSVHMRRGTGEEAGDRLSRGKGATRCHCVQPWERVPQGRAQGATGACAERAEVPQERAQGATGACAGCAGACAERAEMPQERAQGATGACAERAEPGQVQMPFSLQALGRLAGYFGFPPAYLAYMPRQHELAAGGPSGMSVLQASCCTCKPART